MIDCSKEIHNYHGEKVRLGEKQRGEMRQRRSANQNRVKTDLKNKGQPTPKRFVKQGSYAMHTMVQHPENDYDIDDGAIFDRDDLTGPQGGDISPRKARDIVRDAVNDGSFTTPPETLKNCVRVYYSGNYHVDIPVYREYEDDNGDTILELASSEWRNSDPTKLTEWFNNAVIDRSPDENNGRQMRRIVCLLKKFARSRSSWKLPSGLILSVLTDENYCPNDGRDDQALFDTMQAIYSRLVMSGHQVFNPVDGSEELTQGPDDSKMQELEDRLKWALDKLRPAKNETCTKNEALKLWKEVFGKDDFFDQFIEEDEGKENKAVNTLVASAATTSPRQWAG